MLTLIIFWGSSFVVVKVTLMEGLTPTAIATYRFLLAGAFSLLAFNLRKGQNSKSIEKQDLPRLLLLSLTGVTFFFIAQYTGIQMAGASTAAILVCLLSPVFIAVFSHLLFKEGLTKKQVVGATIAATGTVVVIAGGHSNFSSGNMFFQGSLILLSTPFLWTIYSLLGKKVMSTYDNFQVVTYVTILGGLCLIPFSLAENSFSEVFAAGARSWLAILYLAATCSLLGYHIWFYVLKRVGASITSSFLFAEPLVTVLFAAAFVGEVLSLFTFAGGLLLFVGVYLVTTQG